MRETERMIMLNVIDNQWKDHLLSMDHLKEGIGLRGYGQKDPLIEYKKESYVLFQDMMDRIEDETIRYLFFLQCSRRASRRRQWSRRRAGTCAAVRRGRGRGRRRGRRRALVAAPSEQRRGRADSVLDFTRNIQRKKEKEMAELQFVGGSGTATRRSRPSRQEGRPQRSLPLRQRQEVQKMLRSLIVAAASCFLGLRRRSGRTN